MLCAVIGQLIPDGAIFHDGGAIFHDGGTIFHDGGAIECTFAVIMAPECFFFMEEYSIRAKLFRFIFMMIIS